MATTAAASRQAVQVARRLRREYPDAECSLVHDSPLELLVATILSAQCTDERVNIVTKELFRKYRDAAAFAAAPLAELERAIQSTGFFRNKAKNIKACCQTLVDEHGGEVPRTLEATGRAAGRRPQDGQRRAGHRLWHRHGRGRRHARGAAQPAAGADRRRPTR